MNEPSTTPDPLAYKQWTPAAQRVALERLQELRNDRWRPFYCQNAQCNGKPHDDWQWNHARADQRPPIGKSWLTWLLMSGRGSGKTRSGSEWVHRAVDFMPRVALIAPTGADARDIMLEGESGILTIAAPGKRPHYEPSKRRLTWPNGAVATVFSAEEPDRLRGPEHYCAWLDEGAYMPLINDVWSNLLFGLRLGRRPRIVVTTTPKPRPWLKELVADERTILSKASTFDNLDNLSPVFAEEIISRYDGTRLGRQELYAELLTDVEGALWSWEMVEESRVKAAPDEFDRIVVGVDPAGTSKKSSDETGIVVAGAAGGEYFVLEDKSGRYSPHGWASAVRNAYDDWSADAVVVETNYGGDMVEHTLRTSGVQARLLKVQARRSKALRAEPVVGLYEQGKVRHVGTFPALETQLTEWVPFDGESPDRVDAMVYALTQLSQGRRRAQIASPLTASRPNLRVVV
jgi:phage terminase large subunit-like protein